CWCWSATWRAGCFATPTRFPSARCWASSARWPSSPSCMPGRVMAEAATASPHRAAERRTVLAICAIATAVCAVFLFVGLRGNVAFVLGLRLSQLLGLVQVAVSAAVSTVIFQTITGNRILSPSIMGLDALYLFCQTVLVFALGGFGYAALPPAWKFSGEVALMMAISLALFLPMLRRRSDMMLMILTGFVLGLMFRSLSALVARLI